MSEEMAAACVYEHCQQPIVGDAPYLTLGDAGYVHRTCLRVWHMTTGNPDPLPQDGPAIFLACVHPAEPSAADVTLPTGATGNEMEATASLIETAAQLNDQKEGQGVVGEPSTKQWDIKEHPECAHCNKEIQRGIASVYGPDGKPAPYHKSCVSKMRNKWKRELKKVEKANAPKCPRCEKATDVNKKTCITASDNNVWHRRCLSAASKEAGLPDPFAKTEMIVCQVCQAEVPRDQLRAHVDQHSAEAGVADSNTI